MNSTPDFFCLRGNEGDSINFNPSKGMMNNPDPETLHEIFVHAVGLTNYKKWELLSPFGGRLHYSVDLQRMILFLSSFSPSGKVDTFTIPLDSIFSVLVKDDFLYILCESGLMHIFSIQDGTWLMRFPKKNVSRTGKLLCCCENWVKRVVSLLFGKKGSR